MNQTSHPPARPKKGWARALCTAGLALLLGGAAHAQAPTIGISGGPALQEGGAGSPNTANVVVTASAAASPAGATVFYTISSDFSNTPAGATPSEDLSVSSNRFNTINSDGSIDGSVFIGSGSTTANIRIGAQRDGIAERTEGFSIRITGVQGRSADNGTTAGQNYGINTGSDITFGSVGEQSFTPGLVEFSPAVNTSPVVENATGTIANPLKTFNIRLRGDIPQNSTEESALQYTVRVRVSVSVTYRDANGNPIGTVSNVSPLIASNDRHAVNPGDASAASFQDFEFPTGDITRTPVSIALVYAGDDNQSPLFSNTNIFQDQSANSPSINISARIIQNNPPSNILSLYPNTGDGNGNTDNASFKRFSPQGIDLFPVNTNFVTSEDPNAKQGSATSNPDGSTDTNQSNRAYIPIALRNLDLINPDGTLNDDAQPKADMFLPLTSQDTTEGLLSYFVIQDGRVVFIQSIPQSFVTLRYSVDPTSPEYFRNPHYVIATGVDDLLQDGDVVYQLRFGNPQTTDTEFSSINFFDFTVISLRNTDNEQIPSSTDASAPGVLYVPGGETAPTLTTSEDGSQTTFGVRLRSAPVVGDDPAKLGVGYVTLTFTSPRPDEVLLVDPTTGQLSSQIAINFFASKPASFGSFSPSQSIWNQALNITAVGIDDAANPLLDGPATFPLEVRTRESDTSDPAYRLIDPADPTITNNDNESVSFTVSPSNVVVSENGRATFTVRINSVPTAAVTVNLTNSDPTAISISPSTLTFTPVNRTVTVTVVGISDNALTPTSRIANITFAPAISSDRNYNGVVIPQVPVTVLNTDTLFTFSKTSGLVTTESGGTDTFTVALKSRPSANVVLTLSATSTPNKEVQLRTGTSTTAADSVALTFTPANFATPQTVTVVGVNDLVNDGEAAFTIKGTTTSTDGAFTGQLTPDVTGVNKPQSLVVTPTTGLVTTEAGGTAEFRVSLGTVPTSNVVITLTSSDTTEATLAGGATQTLTFTPANYNVPQIVTVTGVDDSIVDGNVAFTITGAISTTDATYGAQSFPTVSGVNNDNDTDPSTGGSNGTGRNYAAGSVNLISYPYTLKTDGSRTGTATVAQAFGPLSDSSGARYQLFRYDSANQKNSFTAGSGGAGSGSDWVAMGPTETLKLGQGYLLKVLNNGSVSMNTPNDSALLTEVAGTSFGLSLQRNANFVRQTRKSQSFNGYNLIGFPFSPTTYSAVNLSNVQVTALTGKKVRTYETFAKAAAAGVIKGRVFGLDAQGRLTQLNATNYSLTEYSAVFVQSFRESGQITFTLRNPS